MTPRSLFRPVIATLLVLSWGGSAAHASGPREALAKQLAQRTLGEDPQFTALVQKNDYEAALGFVCQKYDLHCDQYRIKINKKEVDGSYATTSPYTDTIRINPSAFQYMGRAHPGWVAALLHHEMVHTRQSRYIRTVVIAGQERLLHRFKWTAVLELEAWDAMRENVDRFQLNCVMQLEIQDRIIYYSTLLSNDGKAPKDESEELEHFSLPNSLRQAFEKQCLEKSAVPHTE